MDLKFTDDAQETMNKFFNLWPIATKNSYEKKAIKALECYLLKKKQDEITKDDLLEVLKETFPTFETTLEGLKDPKIPMQKMKAQNELNKSNPLIKIKRWDVPKIEFQEPVKDVYALMMSPRKGGSTDCIMDALLEGAKECGCNVEKQYFQNLNTSPCMGCLKCQEKELKDYCVLKDDISAYVFHRFIECDAFVMGFPVYCGRECAQAAKFIDRFKSLNVIGKGPRTKKNRRGALVVTWGWISEDFYNHVVNNAAFILKMFQVETAEIVTGSGFWGAYYEKGVAKLDKQGMIQAKLAGKSLVSG
jgi:multimeric flavodoxin WrbA